MENPETKEGDYMQIPLI